MHAYADSNDGRFPPAASRDQEGRPLLSWRVLLLPYVEQAALYQEFHLDEPWDSPHNLTLLPKMPKVYAVPAYNGAANAPGRTCYQAFTGHNTAFEIVAGPRLPNDFPKGQAFTALVVETDEA